MTVGAVLTRQALAKVVLDWAADWGLPLMVGNGFLCREVFAEGDGDHVMYLLAGMGLAPGVAAGVSSATGLPTVALEGDGNHLMGLSASASVARARLPVTQIVHWNGGWESTGGQPIFAEGDIADVGPVFGYALSASARTEGELREALEQAGRTRGPKLIHAIGSMGDPSRPRLTLTMTENARRFEAWLANCKGWSD